MRKGLAQIYEQPTPDAAIDQGDRSNDVPILTIKAFHAEFGRITKDTAKTDTLVLTMVPWPAQPCPHPDCRKHIRDLLAEMVPNEEQATPEFKAVSGQQAGGSITCPYCQRAVEYASDGETLLISQQSPLRYSRKKMESRAKDYGCQKSPPQPDMTPEQWIAEEKLMPNALQEYIYAEDLGP